MVSGIGRLDERKEQEFLGYESTGAKPHKCRYRKYTANTKTLFVLRYNPPFSFVLYCGTGPELSTSDHIYHHILQTEDGIMVSVYRLEFFVDDPPKVNLFLIIPLLLNYIQVVRLIYYLLF